MAKKNQRPASDQNIERVRISLITDELMKRSLTAWKSALARCGDPGLLHVEFFLYETGCPAMLDAWAKAIESHQPDYQNAMNSAKLLRTVASTLRQMQEIAHTYQEREDAEYEEDKAIRDHGVSSG